MRTLRVSRLMLATSLDAAASKIVLDDALLQGGQVDLAAVFGNSRPVEMEIGTGKGTFLLARARQRPELNFLGLEWARGYCEYAADRCRRAGLGNVRLLRVDAQVFLRHCLPNDCLLRLHIYFPDPWPKRRHQRRRLICPEFIAQTVRVLMPGAQLLIVTDHLDYFRHIDCLAQAAPQLARIYMPHFAQKPGELVGTNFERKYLAQGRPLYMVARLKYADALSKPYCLSAGV